MNNISYQQLELFIKEFHRRNCRHRVFDDSKVSEYINAKDYQMISDFIIGKFLSFEPERKGKPYELMRYAVNKYLAPSILTSSAFCKKSLDTAILIGCGRYTFFNSDQGTGLLKNLHYEYINETDNNKNIISLGILSNISYNFYKKEFENILSYVSENWSLGSALAFDYLSDTYDSFSLKTKEFISDIVGPVRNYYTYKEPEQLFSSYGFLIFEHLDHEETNEQYLREYNIKNIRQQMKVHAGHNMCLAVKRR